SAKLKQSNIRNRATSQAIAFVPVLSLKSVKAANTSRSLWCAIKSKREFASVSRSSQYYSANSQNSVYFVRYTVAFFGCGLCYGKGIAVSTRQVLRTHN